MMGTTTAATIGSTTAEASKVSFDPSLAKPHLLETVASKRHRMKFLSRRVKSQDEDEDEDEDEAEIKRLQRRVEYLEKKKTLVQKITKIERGIEAVDAESDDDSSSEKQVSPKRWRSFRLRRWKNRDRNDSSEDDLTSDDDDNSPLLQKVNSALDYIGDACSHKLTDLNVVCTDLLLSLDNGQVLDVDGSSNRSKAAHEDSIIEQDVKSKSHETPKDSQVSSLAPIINMLTKQTSLSFSRTEDFLEQKKPSSYGAHFNWKSAPTNAMPAAENDSSRGLEKHKRDNTRIPGHNEQEAGCMNKPANVLSEPSQCLVLITETGDVGHGCAKTITANPEGEPAIEPVDEMDVKLVKVTVTAMALSGLSISSKTNHQAGIPPVRAVLSILKNRTSDERSVFSHLPSLHVIQDTSRRPAKKSKFDRSTKYHVMGLWDISKEDDLPIPGEGKSSVTFSRSVGMSTFEKINKKPEATLSTSTIHLRVCIMRDHMDDILPVGVADVPISGWEPRDVELAVPVRPEYYKSITDLTKKLDTKPPQSKWESFKTFVLEDEDDVLSCVRFRGFKNETYHLEKDSLIRVRLEIVPYRQEQQSQFSASLHMSEGTVTKSESQGFHGTSEQTECQDKKSFTLPEVRRVVETARVISNIEKPSIDTSATVENDKGNGGDRSRVKGSFRKVVTQVGGAADKPSINSPDAYPTVNATKNKENIANAVVNPLKSVDECFAEKVVSKKSTKAWFQRTKMAKTTETDVLNGSQSMLDTNSDIENNAKGATTCVDAATQESRELENDQTRHAKHSCAGVVGAEQKLIDMACPENTTNYVAPLDSAHKVAFQQLERKCGIDALQADQVAGMKGSEDAQPQANGSDKSATKKPGKDKSLKSNKSWLKQTSKVSKTETSPSLCYGSVKETVASDPSLKLSPRSSDDGHALVSHEMVADDCKIHKDSSDPQVEDILRSNSEEFRRNLVATSLKSKKVCSSRAISSEFTEDSLQVVNGRKSLLGLPAAAAETSVTMNESSSNLPSNVDFVETLRAGTMKRGQLEISERTKCMEGNSQFAGEVEVTPEDFLKAAEVTKVQSDDEFGLFARSKPSFSNRDTCLLDKHGDGVQIDRSVDSFKIMADDYYDLSKRNCEDCKTKSLIPQCGEGEELCESIELELKKKAGKSHVRSRRKLLSDKNCSF